MVSTPTCSASYLELPVPHESRLIQDFKAQSSDSRPRALSGNVQYFTLLEALRLPAKAIAKSSYFLLVLICECSSDSSLPYRGNVGHYSSDGCYIYIDGGIQCESITITAPHLNSLPTNITRGHSRFLILRVGSYCTSNALSFEYRAVHHASRRGQWKHHSMLCLPQRSLKACD